MASTGPTSGIRFSGLASGIDTESIITKLMQLEKIPVQRLQTRQAEVQFKKQVYAQLKSQVEAYRTALTTLNGTAAYNAIKADSSDKEVATVSATSGAPAGTFALEVSKLAAAHKVSSSAQTSSDAALGQSGTFVLNGKAITVEATDTLAGIASKVNNGQTGVTASVINGGAGNVFLTLTASKTGAANAIQLGDVTGSAAANLGLVGGAAALRKPVGDHARSAVFTSATTDLKDLTLLSKAGTVQVNGFDVSLDFSTDSLEDVAAKINAATGTATASVVSIATDEGTRYELELRGNGGPVALGDPDGLLAGLGVLQRAFSTPVVQAQDAAYTLDDVPLTSATNTITTVVPGATITLLKADSTTPKSATLTLTRDDAAIVNQFKGLVTAHNQLADFMTQNSGFDTKTYESGPLFGDTAVAQIEAKMAALVFESRDVGEYANLTELGFDLDDKGKLKLDESKLSKALTDRPDDVRKLMMATGSSAASGVQYISSTSKTKPGRYEINITQLATKGHTASSVVPTQPNAGGEVLTFGGKLFGDRTVALTVDQGSSLADLVSKINTDSRLKSSVIASVEGGKLKVESLRYGTNGNFSLVSNLAAGVDNSGIGTDGGAAMLGVDVDGTINGEAATGSGQYLSGDIGNANTEGLQFIYTGTTTGLVGDFTFTRGVAAEFEFQLGAYMDSTSGLFKSLDDALIDQDEDLAAQIVQMNESISAKELVLRSKFAAMESAISAMNQQQQQLASMIGGLSSSAPKSSS